MAQIVYDGPDGIERLSEIDEKNIWYHADTGYWVVMMAEDDDGMCVLRRIPDGKVYYVEQCQTAEELNGEWAPEFE